MGVSQDANGWTVVTASGTPQDGFNTGAPASGNTMQIYVSSSTGKDSGDPGFNSAIQGSSTQPYRTLAAGLARMRTNEADWLLLKKGDFWTDEGIAFPANVGTSADAPMLLGSYGSGNRPQLRHGAGDVLAFNFGGGYVAIIGIDVYNDKRDPSNATGRYDKTLWAGSAAGISALNPANWILVEDCTISFYPNNLTLQGAHQIISLRRNRILDAYYCGSGGSGGLFGHDTVVSFLMEENLFDHNGWNENLANGVSVTITSGTPGTASISSPNTPLNNMGITFDSSGNGITAGTLYFVLNVSGTNFNISTTNDGSSGLITFTGSGSNTATLSSPQLGFSHNFYMSAYSAPRAASCPTTIRGNIFARDASSCQIRGGGTVSNNLWVEAPIMTSFGMPTAFGSTLTDNVIIHSKAAQSGTGAGVGSGVDAFAVYNPGLPDNAGYSYYNIGSLTITRNIWAHRIFNASTTQCIALFGYLDRNVTITSASPGVVSGFEPMGEGEGVIFLNNGDTLPSPLAFNTTYYAVNAAVAPGTTFNIATTPGGTPINTSGGSGTHLGRLANSNTQNVSIFGNIFWDFFTGGSGTEINDLGGTNNNIGVNVLHGSSNTNDVTPPYLDPTRSVSGYYLSIGSPGGFATSTAGFLSAARLQSKDNWNTALMANSVNDFIQEGFTTGSNVTLMGQACM